MNSQALQFLKAILGDDGASALIKAGERSTTLQSAVLPRSIMAWLSFAARWGYEGEVPGCHDSYLEFHKSDADSFDGAITIGPETYGFDRAPLVHVAAAMAVALGADSQTIDPRLKEVDVARLGKNLDLLIGTRFLNFAKRAQRDLAERSSEESSSEESSSLDKFQVDPAGRHGVAGAAPRAPVEPVEPTPPQPKQLKGQVKAKIPAIKITKSQADHECVVCGAAQFTGTELTFCHCLRDLKKFAKATSGNNGYTIQFSSEWSQDDLSVFLDMIGDSND